LTNVTTGAELPQPDCIVIYTDGSCQPNPGQGGYAAILYRYIDGRLLTHWNLSGREADTTNNAMEMRAAVEALRLIKRGEGTPIFIRSDSKYLIDGMNKWLPGWIAKGWRKSDGKPVENFCLWQEIIGLCEGLDVTFQWVRGHSADPANAAVDLLAAKARDQRTRRTIKVLEGETA